MATASSMLESVLSVESVRVRCFGFLEKPIVQDVGVCPLEGGGRFRFLLLLLLLLCSLLLLLVLILFLLVCDFELCLGGSRAVGSGGTLDGFVSWPKSSPRAAESCFVLEFCFLANDKDVVDDDEEEATSIHIGETSSGSFRVSMRTILGMGVTFFGSFLRFRLGGGSGVEQVALDFELDFDFGSLLLSMFRRS